MAENRVRAQFDLGSGAEVCGVWAIRTLRGLDSKRLKLAAAKNEGLGATVISGNECEQHRIFSRAKW